MLRRLFSFFNKRQADGDLKLKAWLLADDESYDGLKVQKPFAQVSWVYACVTAIARNIASVPFKLFKDGILLEEGPLYRLFRDVNPYLSRWQLWEHTMTLLELQGNALWILDYPGGDSTKVPVRIWVFSKDCFTPVIRDGRLVGWIFEHQGIRESFAPEEIIHFRYVNPYNEFWGIGPLEAARLAVEQDWWAALYNKAVLHNGAEPGGVLETDRDLTEEQIRILRKQWESRHGGPDRARRIAILSGGLKWKSIGLSPKDMEFLEARKFSREEICAVFKVPPVEVGIMEYARYANADIQRRIFWETNLIPKIRYLEDKLASEFFPRVAPDVVGRFVLEEVPALRESYDDKVNTAYKLWQMGVPINIINERLNLGLPELPWGNEWWISFNLIPASSLTGKTEEKAFPPGVKTLRVKGENEDRRDQIWRAYLQQFEEVETGFKGKIRRFFWEQRQRILKRLSELKIKAVSKDISDELFDEEEENTRLIVRVEQAYKTAFELGVLLLLEEGVEFDWSFNDHEVIDYLKILANRITSINRTMKKQIRREILEGLANREGVKEIEERIKKLYNFASKRALTIARTETCAAVEGGKFYGKQKAGIQLHMWVSARDERVRHSHWACDGKIVRVGEPFPNGLRFPGDPLGPAREVINCRCTTIYVEG